MKKAYKIVGICVIGCLLLAPMLANARTSYSTYNINVRDSDEYVGDSPEVIYIKSNMKVPGDLLTTTWNFDKYFIGIWTKISGTWFFVNDNWFYNEVDTPNDITDVDNDFCMNVGTYRKHWYSSTVHWKFTGIIEDNNEVYFQNTGKHRVNIEIYGSVIYWYWDLTWEIVDFRIYGTSGSFTVDPT